MQDMGLEVGLVGKLWALLCWAALPTGVHDQSWGCTRLEKAVVLAGIHVDWVMCRAEISCDTHRCI